MAAAELEMSSDVIASQSFQRQGDQGDREGGDFPQLDASPTVLPVPPSGSLAELASTSSTVDPQDQTHPGARLDPGPERPAQSEVSSPSIQRRPTPTPPLSSSPEGASPVTSSLDVVPPPSTSGPAPTESTDRAESTDLDAAPAVQRWVAPANDLPSLADSTETEAARSPSRPAIDDGGLDAFLSDAGLDGEGLISPSSLPIPNAPSAAYASPAVAASPPAIEPDLQTQPLAGTARPEGQIQGQAPLAALSEVSGELPSELPSMAQSTDLDAAPTVQRREAPANNDLPSLADSTETEAARSPLTANRQPLDAAGLDSSLSTATSDGNVVPSTTALPTPAPSDSSPAITASLSAIEPGLQAQPLAGAARPEGQSQNQDLFTPPLFEASADLPVSTATSGEDGTAIQRQGDPAEEFSPSSDALAGAEAPGNNPPSEAVAPTTTAPTALTSEGPIPSTQTTQTPAEITPLRDAAVQDAPTLLQRRSEATPPSDRPISDAPSADIPSTVDNPADDAAAPLPPSPSANPAASIAAGLAIAPEFLDVGTIPAIGAGASTPIARSPDFNAPALEALASGSPGSEMPGTGSSGSDMPGPATSDSGFEPDNRDMTSYSSQQADGRAETGRLQRSPSERASAIAHPGEPETIPPPSPIPPAIATSSPETITSVPDSETGLSFSDAGTDAITETGIGDPSLSSPGAEMGEVLQRSPLAAPALPMEALPSERLTSPSPDPQPLGESAVLPINAAIAIQPPSIDVAPTVTPPTGNIERKAEQPAIPIPFRDADAISSPPALNDPAETSPPTLDASPSASTPTIQAFTDPVQQDGQSPLVLPTASADMAIPPQTITPTPAAQPKDKPVAQPAAQPELFPEVDFPPLPSALRSLSVIQPFQLPEQPLMRMTDPASLSLPSPAPVPKLAPPITPAAETPSPSTPTMQRQSQATPSSPSLETVMATVSGDPLTEPRPSESAPSPSPLLPPSSTSAGPAEPPQIQRQMASSVASPLAWDSIESLLNAPLPKKDNDSSPSASHSIPPTVDPYPDLKPFQTVQRRLAQPKADLIQRNDVDSSTTLTVGDFDELSSDSGASLETLDMLVRQVYGLICQRLAVERERHGLFRRR